MASIEDANASFNLLTVLGHRFNPPDRLVTDTRWYQATLASINAVWGNKTETVYSVAESGHPNITHLFKAYCEFLNCSSYSSDIPVRTLNKRLELFRRTYNERFV
ncbi:hypothetical protein QF001_001616 [Paraburkholderia youngii]